MCRQGLPCIAVTEESTATAQLLQSWVTTSTLWLSKPFFLGCPWAAWADLWSDVDQTN